MPKYYEPLTFDRSIYPTYQHYIAYIRSLTVDPYELIDDFLELHVEIIEGEAVPRVHGIELYREFTLFGIKEPKLFGDISKAQFFRHVKYFTGGVRQTYYILGYFPNLKVFRPVSGSLIKLYDLDIPNDRELCATCGSSLDTNRYGGIMECLVCKINRDKKIWSQYHAEKKKVNRLKKSTQAPKG